MKSIITEMTANRLTHRMVTAAPDINTSIFKFGIAFADSLVVGVGRDDIWILQTFCQINNLHDLHGARSFLNTLA